MVLTCLVYGQADSPYVIIIEDTVEFGIADLYRNCGAIFTMDAQLEDSIFTITAIDTGEPALCGLCYFDVEIIIGGIDPGNYLANYYSLDPIDIDSTGEWIHDTTYIGEVQFSIATNIVTTYEILSSNQSECSHTQGIKELSIPDEYVLLNNYPNPFNNSTVIEFYISNNQNVYISVYDINGRLVSEIASDNYNSGYHSLSWNPTNSPSGLYLLSIVTGSQNRTKKVLLIK